MKKTLDFICIGAAKSATSTLFELMVNHPDLFMPPSKEVPYFNDKKSMEKGWSWYIKTFFSGAGNSQVIGKITPQYMSGTNEYTPEDICENIHKELPGVKIIILLRNPIERSYSQYKMHQRFGYFEKTFEETVEPLLRLDPGKQNKERENLRQDKNVFFFASEYGRIMEAYYKKFPKKNILVLYTENLKKNPETVLKNIFEFLNVDTNYRPDNINRHSHRGGKAKIKYLAPAYIHKVPGLNFIWTSFVPAKMRKKIFMRISRWNVKPSDDKLDPSSDLYKKLVNYFRDDIKVLEKETSTKTPWEEWR